MSGVVVHAPVLGIFGGGQLARMTTVAAQALGLRVRVLDPDPRCPAATVADELIVATYDDPIGAQRLALGCIAVTVDLENVALEALEAAAQHVSVHPAPRVLHIVQDRSRQRRWLEDHAFPTPPLRHVNTPEALRAAIAELGMPAYVKATRGGYDGKGQVRVDSEAQLPDASRLVSAVPCVVEANVPYVAELSVQVARSANGETSTFAPAWNHHEEQILHWTMLPAPIAPQTASAARALAVQIAETLDVVGLLTVELFLLDDGTLWVNELAPRPHNSFHTTLVGTRSSQFAQVARAVSGMPLGGVDTFATTVVANLLGEQWGDGGVLSVDGALAVPGVDVTIYGKRMARLGRKMGHLTATGATPADAFARARDAMQRLGAPLHGAPPSGV